MYRYVCTVVSLQATYSAVVLPGPIHPSPGEHVTSTPVAIGIGAAFLSPLERHKATSRRELWCRHAAQGYASSGQQGEQVELALNYNFSIHYF
jgi:hypothetical protein